jgi:hypothetical protein
MDEPDDIDFPATPTGRRPTMPRELGGGMTHATEFNPMLELFGTGENAYDVDTRTELTDFEILQISRGRFLAAHFDLPELDDWLNSILRLKISRGRKSRSEAVEAVKAMNGIGQEVRTATGLMERLRR